MKYQCLLSLVLRVMCSNFCYWQVNCNQCDLSYQFIMTGKPMSDQSKMMIVICGNFCVCNLGGYRTAMTLSSLSDLCGLYTVCDVISHCLDMSLNGDVSKVQTPFCFVKKLAIFGIKMSFIDQIIF